jgi:hypothetical protein
MRNQTPPFKFDLRELIADARRKLNSRVGGVTVSLPFISFSVQPQDLEKKVAAEIVIRMADRRVLTTFECCDNCVEHALTSLQEVRAFLVTKQVELAQTANGPLAFLVRAMLESIRQFLIFQDRIAHAGKGSGLLDGDGHPIGGPHRERELYSSALEMLRGHLHRCLQQVAKIAAIEVPKTALHYSESWRHTSQQGERNSCGSALGQTPASAE